MVKFVKRFEKIRGVRKAVYLPNTLHLTIFYKEGFKRDDIKRKVLINLKKSNLELSPSAEGRLIIVNEFVCGLTQIQNINYGKLLLNFH